MPIEQKNNRGMTISVYLEIEQIEWLKEQARIADRSLSFVIRSTIESAMEEDYGRELNNGQQPNSD